MCYAEREIIIIEQFMNGIGISGIWSHVILHHPKTLESAMSSAKELKAVKGPQLSLTKLCVHAVQYIKVTSPDELLNALKSSEISVNKLSIKQR